VGTRNKTVLYRDSINLVFGKNYATGDAAKPVAESSKEMSKEENSTKNLLHRPL
jgi:hypothetical protein